MGAGSPKSPSTVISSPALSPYLYPLPALSMPPRHVNSPRQTINDNLFHHTPPPFRRPRPSSMRYASAPSATGHGKPNWFSPTWSNQLDEPAVPYDDHAVVGGHHLPLFASNSYAHWAGDLGSPLTSPPPLHRRSNSASAAYPCLTPSSS